MTNGQFTKLVEQLYTLCFEADSEPYEVEDMFRDFKKAQKLMIDSIIKIEGEIYNLKSIRTKQSLVKIDRLERQRAIIKDFANSIAWMLLGCSTSRVRAHYGAGPDGAHLKDRNIETSLKLIDECKSKKHAMILLTDLTTNVNIGDLLLAKNGVPPQVIELKEGSKSAELLPLAYDDEALRGYLKPLAEKEKKVSERQVRRLKSQIKRIQSLTDYLKDSSKRYDETIGQNVHIVKPKEELLEQTYSKLLQSAYNNLAQGGEEIIEIPGGMYVMVTKTSPSDISIFKFQHHLYHRLSLHTDRQCMFNDQKLSQGEIQQEMLNVMRIHVYTGIQGLANAGYEPATSALTELGRDLALDLLLQRSTIYFYFDTTAFLEYITVSGLSWSFQKVANNTPEDKALFKYNNRGVQIEKMSMLTSSFLDRMLINYTTPSYEIDHLKQALSVAKSLIDDLASKDAD